MTDWYTSDPHFGHARIIELCNRPFAGVTAMNETIIARFNAVVAPEDNLYVLGDVALGVIAETLPLCARLNGKKRLVPGNHDRCWPGNKKVRPVDVSRYEDVGFEILPGDFVDPHGWRLCHFPYAGDSHDEDRYKEFRPVPAYPGQWLIHGHVHERWQVRDRQINVGVDVWNFWPVHEDELAGIMAVGG